MCKAGKGLIQNDADAVKWYRMALANPRRDVLFKRQAQAQLDKLLAAAPQTRKSETETRSGYRILTSQFVESFEDKLLSYKFAPPPLPDQRRFVTKLNELMTLRDQLSVRLKTARELAATYASAATEAALEAA